MVTYVTHPFWREFRHEELDTPVGVLVVFGAEALELLGVLRSRDFHELGV